MKHGHTESATDISSAFARNLASSSCMWNCVIEGGWKLTGATVRIMQRLHPARLWLRGRVGFDVGFVIMTIMARDG